MHNKLKANNMGIVDLEALREAYRIKKEKESKKLSVDEKLVQRLHKEFGLPIGTKITRMYPNRAWQASGRFKWVSETCPQYGSQQSVRELVSCRELKRYGMGLVEIIGTK